MTFSKLNAAMGATLKTLFACAVVSIAGLAIGGVIGVPLAFIAQEGGPVIVGAAIGWFIAMGVFAHNLDSTKPD
jgi:hypothetical protein